MPPRRPLCSRGSSRPGLAPPGGAPAPPAVAGLAAPGRTPRRDGARPAGPAPSRGSLSRAGHRPPRLVGRMARAPPRRAWAPPDRLRDRRLALGLACLMLLCHGLAARGFMKGDAFLTSTIGLVVALVASSSSGRSLTVLASAVRDEAGALAPPSSSRSSARSVGPGLPAGRSGAASPGTRCSSRSWWGPADDPGPRLRPDRHPDRIPGEAPPARPVLPIITPPFVIGLALILLFGRSGAVTTLLSDWFGFRERAGSTGCRGS